MITALRMGSGTHL